MLRCLAPRLLVASMATDVESSADGPQAPPPASTQYVAHPLRWSLLAVYAAASLMGALVWNILVRASGVLSPLLHGGLHVRRSVRG